MDQSRQPRGAIAEFLASDHRRLEALFQAALANPDRVDHDAYTQFRAGLLRHIGMEEKILLPAIQQWRGGNPWPLAAKLRLDHGAIASLLMPPPTPAIVAMLRTILETHNELEEGPNGLYAVGDELAGPESEQFVARLKAAPLVSVMPYSDTEAVRTTMRRALERAGYQFEG
jgi:hypothetical protein